MKERNGDSSARGELRATGASSEKNEASPEARGLSQTMRDPDRRKRNVRQTAKSHCQPSSGIASAKLELPRDSGFVLTNPESQKDGDGGESSSFSTRPNGVTAKGATTNGKRNSQERSDKSLAASDDATGATPAGDAPSAAACTGRDACAEVAGSFSDGCTHSQARNSGQAGTGEASGTVDDRRPRASGDAPLAYDAPGFVEEMHMRVNLYAEYEALLKTEDLKIKQRALELLLEMKYGRGAPSSAEEAPLRVDVEFPKPQK